MHRSVPQLASVSGLILTLALPGVALAEGPLDDSPAFAISAVVRPSDTGTDFSNRIGMTTESFGAWGVLGFDRTGRHVDGNNSTAQSIQLGVGGRYLLRAPAKATAAPYIYGQAMTNRNSAASDREAMDDLASDINRYSLFAGFGGEVAITGALTVAAEIGLQHDVVDYENDVRLMSIHTHLDTGLLLNVYF
jgi:hypothetical protein